MKWETLVQSLFDTQHSISEQDLFLQGNAEFDGQALAVIGTTEHAPIGVALALTQAQAVLDTIKNHPGRSLLLLVDTQGQQLRRRDELLGINRAMAHLGMCLDLARRKGHKVIGLVYDQALSGGFITSGLIADACYAVPEAEIRVMRIPAMARVTKLPESMLEELAQSNPVFAPGVGNYVAMGGIQSVWDSSSPEQLRASLRAALAQSNDQDRRASDGAERGGRRLAAQIIEQVLQAS